MKNFINKVDWRLSHSLFADEVELITVDETAKNNSSTYSSLLRSGVESS